MWQQFVPRPLLKQLEAGKQLDRQAGLIPALENFRPELAVTLPGPDRNAEPLEHRRAIARIEQDIDIPDLVQLGAVQRHGCAAQDPPGMLRGGKRRLDRRKCRFQGKPSVHNCHLP